MRLIEQTLINQNSLILEIDDSLLRIAQKTFHDSRGKPQEPDFIASLVEDFTPELFGILTAYYKGITFGVTSVFAHQKPTVDIGAGKNPELGDLLLVLMHTDSNKRRWLNSLLLQAKMTTAETSVITATDAHQLQLYQDWPDFTYDRSSKSLRGQKRSVRPHTVHDGAQYLMIDKNPVAVAGRVPEFPMGCAVSDQELILDQPFNCEIVDFLKFKSGRVFEARDQVTEDWSQVICDLLDLSAASLSRRINSGRPAFSRQYGATTISSDLFSFHQGDQMRKWQISTMRKKLPCP